MTAGVDRERLQRLLGKPALVRLVQRLRQRLEAGGGASGTLTLADPMAEERRAVEQLLGRSPGQGASLRLSLEHLERVIRDAGIAPDLPTALTVLQGPLVDRHTLAADRRAAWKKVFDTFYQRATVLELQGWLDELQGSGLLKRLTGNDPAQAADWLDKVLRVIAALPRQGSSLSTLAATTLGDAHALDRGRPLATLSRRAIAHKYGVETTDSAERERELWADVGVLVGGALTSNVLVLNLPTATDTGTGRLLNLLGRDGQPGYLTLRQLVRDPPRWQVEGIKIYICENPAVVAEVAERLGSRCAPLICTHGQPGAAVATLLRQLRGEGAELYYHGDFDWPGIQIGNGMMERFAARPWCFDTQAYGAATKGEPLTGKPVAADWDPALMPAMQACGCRVEEEQMLDVLLQDLQGHSMGGRKDYEISR